MAYIGRPSIVGNFVKLDAISVVNGQAAYTMQNSSANFTDYSSVNQFMVSLNGTIQSPGSSFTVSGSTITFASNLVTNDVIDFIIVFGNSLSAGVPTDATVTTAKLANDAVTNAKLSFNANQYRNIIINGDMSVAQRSTSVSSITATGYNTIDRIKTNISSAGTWTQSQSTTVPTGQGFATSLKMDCTTADGSLSAGDALALQHIIEGQNLQYLKKGTSSAESTTLSFWVRSNKTGTYICTLYDNDNNRNISKSYTISSADTWEKKTITYAGDTTGAFGNDNAASLYLNFYLAAGSNYTSGTLATSWESYTQANEAVGQVNLADSTSNEWYVTGIQLEAGSVASDFEFLPVDVNLQRCLRYCYRINGNSSDEQQVGGAAWCTTTSRVNFVAEFNPPLRAVPTVTSSSDIKETVSGTSSMSTGGLFDDNQSGLCNTVGIAVQPSSGTPFTANQVAFPRLANSTSSFIQYDAEL